MKGRRWNVLTGYSGTTGQKADQFVVSDGLWVYSCARGQLPDQECGIFHRCSAYDGEPEQEFGHPVSRARELSAPHHNISDEGVPLTLGLTGCSVKQLNIQRVNLCLDIN